jgi:4-amino-4-deoxy-L-arabinose transferase-like glycosyltransferase
LAIVAALYVLLRIHAVDIPLDRDEGVFGYAGQRILEGERLYRDVVDHKPPGVFYLYALALRLVPPSARGIHAFLHVYNFLTLLAVWALMRRRFASGWAAFWGAACFAAFSASPAIQGFTASTEMLMLLPIVLSLLLAVEAARRPRPWLLLASGVMGAAACWIKPTAVTSIAFVVVYLVATAWRSDGGETVRWREPVRRLSWWAGGGVVLSAAIAGAFAAAGTFRELVYWSFTHNASYTGQATRIANMLDWVVAIADIMHGDFVVVGLGVAVAAWNVGRRPADSAFVLGFLACSVIGTLPGNAYPHYFAQLAPAVAVGSGWALGLGAEGRDGRLRAASLVLGLLLIVVPVALRWNYFFGRSPDEISREIYGVNPFPESPEIGRYLASRTSGSDRIFIFGSEPQILMFAARKSVTPFVMIYPLTGPFARAREFQGRVWRAIVDRPPTYILVVDLQSSLLWDGRSELKFGDQIKELLRRRYRMDAVVPLRDPKASLVVLGDSESPGAHLRRKEPAIYLYRVKAPGDDGPRS